MTILAQLHDCHGCNDERSIVQKKGGREALRAGSTSLRVCLTVSLSRDYQCCAWLLLCVCFLGRFFVVFVLSLVSPFLAFDAQGRHSSKTVTIVVMSAALEQKKRFGLLLFLQRKGDGADWR